MGVRPRTGWLLAALGLLAAFVAPACGASDTAEVVTVRASVLVEPAAADARWFRDVEVPKGTDGYELLEAATEGALDADWFPEFRAHFVKEILGVAPEGAQFWGVFLWNESTSAWEPLPFGADLLSVKEGHVMGWALVEFDPDDPQLPVSVP